MNPKVVLNAFTAAPITVLGLTFQPLRLGHFLALEAIGSPLTKGGDVTATDIVHAAVLLSQSSQLARALAADPARLYAQADGLADDLPPSALPILSETLQRLLTEATATQLAVESKGGVSGESPPPPPPVAASAGRSPSSPTSPPRQASLPPKPSTASRSPKSSQ